MKSLTPSQYAEQVWGGSVTDKTIRNWIKAGKQLKGVERVEVTPTERYVLFLSEKPKSNAQSLVQMMKDNAA